MFSINKIWKYRRLSLDHKIRMYQVLILSTLLYAAETWTLLAEGLRALEAHKELEDYLRNILV